MDQFYDYLQYQKKIAQSKLKVIERFQQLGKRHFNKRASNIDIVQNVLRDQGNCL
jgi:hypothetical protein